MTDQTTASASPAETDDQILDYVHSQRKRIIEAVLPTVGAVTNDPKILGIALQTLDGMSRDALGKKRLKVEEQGAATQEAAAALIATILRKASDVKPYEAETPQQRSAPVELPSHFPPPVLVAGETATVAPQGDYDSFTRAAQRAPGEK
jgi:hypothetical protein